MFDPTHTQETPVYITVFCMYEFKLIPHVNAAAAAHYQISLAWSSNVSEWEPGSESTSDAKAGASSIKVACVCVYVNIVVARAGLI